jgi:hypothetical protein
MLVYAGEFYYEFANPIDDVLKTYAGNSAVSTTSKSVIKISLLGFGSILPI